MYLEQVKPRTRTNVHPPTQTLMIVGPLPPPMGGATLTVQTLLEELAGHASVQTALVDTRLPTHYRQKKVLFGPQTLKRAIFITKQYLEQIRHSHAVLVFANNSFILTLAPLLFGLARFYRKPFFLKPIGGDLDLYLAHQKGPLRSYMLRVLRAMDGILPQTRQLQAALINWGCANTYYVPGCRPTFSVVSAQPESSEKLRLIFLAQIKPEKGILVLLEALRQLAKEGFNGISCDFYGPVYEDSQEQFFRDLEATPGAHYCGVAEPGTASDLIAGYDALALPTHFVSEGHPGVIIEAMQAGVPVISTYHRAIPELITHGENGLLVPVQNSRALAEAIKQLAQDRSLRQQMSQMNYQRAQLFRADVVVSQILEIVLPTP
jgi:glycosyltransferase involved in cell wall biosynthesis